MSETMIATEIVTLTLQAAVKGELHPKIEKLACFALLLKIINTFLKNNIYASYPSRNSKMALEF